MLPHVTIFIIYVSYHNILHYNISYYKKIIIKKESKNPTHDFNKYEMSYKFEFDLQINYRIFFSKFTNFKYFINFVLIHFFEFRIYFNENKY